MTMVQELRPQRPAVGTPQAQCLDTLCATRRARRGRVHVRPRNRDGDECARTLARPCRRGLDGPDVPPRGITVTLDPCAAVSSVPEAACRPTSGQPPCGRGHGCHGGTARAERGREVSTRAIVAVPRRCAFTLAVAPTSPGEDAMVARPAPEATSGAGYRPPRRAPRHRWPPQGTDPGVDGSWANTPDRAAAVRLALPPMTQRRGAAAGRLLDPGPPPQRRGARRPDEGHVAWHDRRRGESRGPVAAAAQRPRSTAVVGPVTRTRQRRLVVGGHRPAPAPPRDLVLAAPALALDGRPRVEGSGARGQSACRGRDRTPCPGLRACHARAEAALACHSPAALATRHLARPAPRFGPTDESPRVCSMARWTPRPCHARGLDVCIEP